MRVAISGSHRTGKSTLLAALSELLPSYATVDEPYHSMEEDGHEFSHPPSVEDFEAQLERSLEDLSGGGDDVLFDRCPVDFLAYLAVHEDAESVDAEEWLPRVRDALATLDLIVFVPIEERDRIELSASDADDPTRAPVDAQLRVMLVDDALELDVEVLEVAGAPARRAKAVLQRIRSG